MRIALFPSAFHPSLGGVEEMVRQLAHALKRGGHEAFVVTECWPRTLPEREEFEGIRVYRFPFRALSGGSALNRARSAVSLALTGSAIRRAVTDVVHSEGADLVNIHCVSNNARYANAVAHSLGLPLVATLHGELTMDATGLFQRSQAARDLLRQTLRQADFITGCSAQTVREAAEFFGEPLEGRARPIFNGISLHEFAGAPPRVHPRPYVLGIGRHVEQKGFDVLLRAFARLVQSGDNTTDLLLAGDGPCRDELKRLSSSLGLEGRAHFVGRVDRAGAMALFKGCAFFVLPSRHEPLGIVNLEAMAAGKAILASRVGGVPEIVHDGDNGLLVEPDDPDALFHALKSLLLHPERARELGQRGAQKAKSFDWDAIAQEYLDVYEVAKARHSAQAEQRAHR